MSHHCSHEKSPMKKPNILSNDASICVIIFICTLLHRLAYLATLEINDPIRGDAGKYLAVAYNLIHSGSYSLALQPPLEPTTLITPGYPFFLSAILFFSKSPSSFYDIALIVQAILSSASAVFVYLISIKIMSKPFAVATCALFIISPHLNIMCGYLLTETLFIFFLMLSLYLLTNSAEHEGSIRFLLSGITIGIACLVRPALLLLPVIIALSYSYHKKWKFKKSYAVLLFAGTAIAYSPWLIWKQWNKDADQVSLFSAALTLGSYPDLIYKSPEFRGKPYLEDSEYDNMAKSPKYALKIILERAQKSPAEYAKWYLYGKETTFLQPGIIAGIGGAFIYPIEKSIYDKVPLESFLYWIMFNSHTFFVVVTFGYIFFCIYKKNLRRQPYPATLLASLILYFLSVHSILAPLPRYSIPIYPAIYILTVYAAYLLLESRRDHN